MDNDGDVRWAPRSIVSTVLGQNDAIAQHDGRLDRMAEREELILGEINKNLHNMSAKIDDMAPRLIRLEERMHHYTNPEE